LEDNNLDIKINQYINGELTGEALQNFEQLLSKDLELAKEVAMHKKIDQVLKAKKNNAGQKILFQQFGEKYILNESSAKVIELNQPETLQKETSNKSILRWLAPLVSVAAAALLIFYMGFGDVNPQKLAAQNFEVYTLDGISRSDGANNLILAQQAYDKENYQKALNLFDQYPGNTATQMAKGNCEFILDKPADAINTFKQLTNKNMDVHIKASARWYLALSYLKMENVELAKNELKEILQSSNHYRKAQILLKKLK